VKAGVSQKISSENMRWLYEAITQEKPLAYQDIPGYITMFYNWYDKVFPDK